MPSTIKIAANNKTKSNVYSNANVKN